MLSRYKEILTAWPFPQTGHIVFSEDSQDGGVGDQPRVSRGKDVRALPWLAFISGLMRPCRQKGLAHPGLVVFDSHLVAYQEPDRSALESARIREAGVQDAVYRALADGLCLGQVLIRENEDLPHDGTQRVTHSHFTKAPNGFYPRSHVSLDVRSLLLCGLA